MEIEIENKNIIQKPPVQKLKPNSNLNPNSHVNVNANANANAGFQNPLYL